VVEIDVVALGSGRCRLAVRAQPGARRSGIAGEWNRHVKVAVRAPAEDCRANRELLEVLAAALEVPRSAVALAAGETSRLKRVEIARDAEWVRARLLELLG
jgi:hypothetical protein